MKDITLTLDDATYWMAQQKAVALDTTIGTVIVEHLRQWAADQEAVEQARRSMTAQFAQPDWQFAVGVADDREQRNARSRSLLPTINRGLSTAKDETGDRQQAVLRSGPLSADHDPS